MTPRGEKVKTATWFVFVILAVTSAWLVLLAQVPVCELPKGLDRQWEQSYRALNRINRAERQQYDSAFASVARITKQYAAFAEQLGNLESTSDGLALRACCRAVDSDRVARQLCARSEYVAGGRKDAAPFLRTLPRNRDELALFWRVDSIVSPDTISMALGLKALEELVRLVYGSCSEILALLE